MVERREHLGPEPVFCATFDVLDQATITAIEEFWLDCAHGIAPDGLGRRRPFSGWGAALRAQDEDTFLA